MEKLNFLLMAIPLILWNCNPADADKDDETINYDLPGWTLIYQDEFDGDAIDLDKWVFQTGGGGWGNDESQYYTDRAENSYIEDGKLVIEARLEDYEGSEFTSARINSKYGWKYKRIDVKAKLPAGVGTWPAIWMLPDEWDYGDGGWPDNGEIDIMEHVGYDPGTIHATIHTDAYNHSIGTQKGDSVFLSDAFSNFHVYSVEWYADSLVFQVDDTPYYTYVKESDDWRKWPFNKDFHLLLNIAVGGTWGGSEGIDKTVFPVKMEIDYVRIYEPAN